MTIEQNIPQVPSSGESELADLRRKTLVEFVPVLFIIGWLAGLRALRFGEHVDSLPVAIVLILGATGALFLRRSYFRLAKYCLIVSVIAAISLEAWIFPESSARFIFPMVVIMSSLLVSHANIYFIAIICSLAWIIVARQIGVDWFDFDYMIVPLGMIYLTTFISWLASRQLRSALDWLQNSYGRARGMLKQLREQRAELARMVSALEEAYSRIERMNNALVEARNAAEEARKIKAEFAANISHELRTPLNLIIGFSETMANAPETYGDFFWPPNLRGDVEQIYNSSRHLSALINDILDLSALDHQRFGLIMDELNINDVIGEASLVMQPLLQAKKLYLNLALSPDLPDIRLDRTRIRQVMINLLNNSSRFTRRGGVTITTELSGKNILVSIQDTGVGIAPQDIPKVFEEFRQVDGSRRRRQGGTGLGVPLSKRLVELHGGEMWLESEIGQGTTFNFILPMESSLHQTGTTSTRRLSDHSLEGYQRSLLVANASPLGFQTIRRYVDHHDVVEVHKSDDVSKLIDTYQPVAMIVDNQGDNAPVEINRKIDDLPPDLPIIAFPIKDSLGNARTMGVKDFLVKPIIRERLLEAIAALDENIHSVLIVDDNVRLVDLLARMLQSTEKDYKVMKAYGGAAALESMRENQPDLLLLDLSMPEIDGLTVLETMRDDPTLRDIPVIIASAHEYLDDENPQGGNALWMVRQEQFSMAELLRCMQALLDSLPVRAPISP